MHSELPGQPLDESLRDAILGLSPRAAFLACCRTGALAFQVARESGQIVFYPRLLAPSSGATDLVWRRSTGQGTVHSATRLSRRDKGTCTILLVDMAEGFRLLGRLIADPSIMPAIGDAVSVDFAEPDEEDRRNGIEDPYPVFRAAPVEARP